MAKNKSLRLVIDTNLWISFIISKKLNQLEPILLAENTRILFSSELVEELQATITKPKLQKYFSENALEEMLTVFDPYIDFITVKSKVVICRDPNDNFLLALAKDGKANYLLTGDNDLLDIGKYEQTIIIKISEFFEQIKS
ncbi:MULTISPECIES: putative toxin-antitoxin system toxin component, PIN family [unclassified Flavobacterium]|jgi:putative PIN family toxin of toxin-antitoxin system|uniref:putative toxin-antitoxin system toxin component, PIN family n=1 Tax=unclassified Flavobacterium TaxID=196869 RepID=UPI0025BCD9B3|nr:MULTISPECIES: putative toxin-antitoxin system toxin component, PIN family [unclassified Flavobacterium]